MANGSIQLLDTDVEREGFLVLVGAISDIANLNKDAFKRAEQSLKMVGYSVWSPTSLWALHGTEQPWRWYMQQSLSRVIWATGIAIVGDVNAAVSSGVRKETTVAEWLGIPIKPWHSWMMDVGVKVLDKEYVTSIPITQEMLDEM